MTIRRLLMCNPTYFDVVYSINPWMNPENRVDKTRAARQWNDLYWTLRKLGVEIALIDPVPGLPDMTFAGDSGMVVGKRFLLSNFRYAERQGEAEHYARWMAAHGYEVLRVPDGIVFEGLGDVVYHENDILFGYGPRSDPEAAAVIRRLFPELSLRGEIYIRDESFFHVALAAAFLAKDVLLYYPEAFSEESRRFLAQTFEKALPVTERDAKEYFVCNNIVLGNKILLDNCTSELERRLERAGFEVIKLDMGEFKKSGGSLRCLVLNLPE